MNLPELKIEQLDCTMSRCAVLAIPASLEGAAKVLKCDTQKDLGGRALMLKMCKPRQPRKAELFTIEKTKVDGKTVKKEMPIPGAEDKIYWNDTFEQVERLVEYCGTDVDTQDAVSDKIPRLIPSEQALYHKTVETNQRGILCDVELCKQAIKIYEACCIDLQSELQEITDGRVNTGGQLDKIHVELQKEKLFLDSLNANTIENTLLRDDITPRARRLLELRQGLSKSSIKKYFSMLNMACDDGRMRGAIGYHVASTGRYGGKIINPQNFTRPTHYGSELDAIFELLKIGDYDLFKMMFPDVLNALSSALRGMIIAGPGNLLFSADFNAIEARVLPWIAEDYENLKNWVSVIDNYIQMATVIYTKPYKLITDSQRFIGKQTVLGCGFGMGADKFKSQLKDQWNVDVSIKLAKSSVKAFRAQHHIICDYETGFWKKIEDAAMDATRKPGVVFKCGRLKWIRRKRFLVCKLPSGRNLYFCDPHFRQKLTPWGEMKKTLHFYGVNSQNKKWQLESTYGGKLTQNVVQGIARDIMCEAMMRVEAHGFKTLFTVHDEVVLEASEDLDIEKFLKLMEIKPDWCQDLPIKVEGWSAKRYRK